MNDRRCSHTPPDRGQAQVAALLLSLTTILGAGAAYLVYSRYYQTLGVRLEALGVSNSSLLGSSALVVLSSIALLFPVVPGIALLGFAPAFMALLSDLDSWGERMFILIIGLFALVLGLALLYVAYVLLLWSGGRNLEKPSLVGVGGVLTLYALFRSGRGLGLLAIAVSCLIWMNAIATAPALARSIDASGMAQPHFYQTSHLSQHEILQGLLTIKGARRLILDGKNRRS
jgi:hypothetical protein